MLKDLEGGQLITELRKMKTCWFAYYVKKQFQTLKNNKKILWYQALICWTYNANILLYHDMKLWPTKHQLQASQIFGSGFTTLRDKASSRVWPNSTLKKEKLTGFLLDKIFFIHWEVL